MHVRKLCVMRSTDPDYANAGFTEWKMLRTGHWRRAGGHVVAMRKQQAGRVSSSRGTSVPADHQARALRSLRRHIERARLRDVTDGSAASVGERGKGRKPERRRSAKNLAQKPRP